MRQAFTLVELSIVLVILGLLVGGVLAGQSLVRAAELRTIHVDVQRYAIAVHSFRRKYSALPGDFERATAVWGEAAAGIGCTTTDSGDVKTCNGNGNGTITLEGEGADYETFRAWQQLSNAGMLDGSFTGVAGSGGTRDADIGRNVPKAKLGRAGYTLRTVEAKRNDADFYDMPSALMLLLGSENGAGETTGPALRPEEAWNVDSKVDDTRPSSGTVRSLKTGGCSTASSTSMGEYNLTNPELACPLVLQTSRR